MKKSFLVAALAQLVVTTPVSAEERPLVVVYDGGAHGEFVATLRIHLAGQATVVVQPSLSSESVAATMTEASADVVQRQAVLGIWFDTDKDGSSLLFAVGQLPGKGVVERVPTTTDKNRTLALKVGALVDEVLKPPPAPVRESPVPRTEVAVAPAPEPVPHQRTRGFIRVSTVALAQPEQPTAQLGGQVSGGVTLSREPVFTRVSIAASAFADKKLTNSVGTATFSELGVDAVGDIQVKVGKRLFVGGRIAVGVRRVSTNAVPSEGEPGRSSSMIPATKVTGTASFDLTRALFLEGATGVGVSLIAEDFTTMGEDIAHISRLYVPVELSLGARW